MVALHLVQGEWLSAGGAPAVLLLPLLRHVRLLEAPEVQEAFGVPRLAFQQVLVDAGALLDFVVGSSARVRMRSGSKVFVRCRL